MTKREMEAMLSTQISSDSKPVRARTAIPPPIFNESSSSSSSSNVFDPAVLEDCAVEDDGLASFGGHGTLEILRLIRVLEENGACCCVTGTSALIYYGADRHRNAWEICLPTEQLEDAKRLLMSPPYKHEYTLIRTPSVTQPQSLAHIYPRFKCVGLDLSFQLLPSQDCHFECKPSNFQRSHNGLPYPRLHVFVQSLLDTHNLVALCDVVDGTNVSEEWGFSNLDLSGTNDVDWALWKNRAIRDSDQSMRLFGVTTAAYSRQETWEKIVRGKEERLGFKHPKEIFATRFRLHGSADPWLTYRKAA
ncbi:MAG: hypothetical protein M1818_007589 [Claussenomyces sp. TS43310]|nr:MAG: hypothetical protein M1818_007589 [Claussenomyces sp. TS43310]